MRIAFDATAILGPMSKNRGIGNYSMGQFIKMLEMDQENEYFFLNLFEEDFCLKEHLEKKANLVETYFYSGKNRFLMEDQFAETTKKIYQKFIKENQIDVFYITSPFDSQCIKYKPDWFEGVKTVALVYDIIPYIFKERYLSDEGGYNWYMGIIDFLRHVDRIQVISQSVKDDLVSYLDFPENRIDVIWGAVDKRYQEIDIEEDKKKELFDKFGIKDRFIMCTGGDDERKNLAGLIEAYSKSGKDVVDKYQLVIVCKLSEGAVERYTELSKELGCEGRVVLTNFVSNEELLYFYNLATLMAFPSTYEGFGLPVVEAWACGTPVLTSNNSSLVQLAGDGAVIVDPFDVEDAARGIHYAMTECDLDELLQKGKEQLKRFQWDVVAKDSIDSLNLLKTELPEKIKEEGRKKLAFFTPLPPKQSGISDYSVDIISELQKYYDIDVFIDDDYQPTGSYGDAVQIFSHEEYEAKREQYIDTVYQVGNSEFHMYMFPYIQKYHGTVVLHDYNLHGVAVYMAFDDHDADYTLYRDLLCSDYDKNDVRNYISKLKKGETGYHIYDMPVNGFVTNYATKVIVHSEEAREKLLYKNIGCDVTHIWSYAKVEDYIADNAKSKVSMGYDPDDFVLAAFGHVHETKRIIPILKAFSKISLQNVKAKLLFVGKLDKNLENLFYQTLDIEKIADKVKVTGYTELDDFIHYIDMTDICLNLRYPYNGETSGSLMRIFAKGKCVIVNDIGSFGEFPDEICAKIPNVMDLSEQQEVEYIENAIMSLMNDSQYMLKMRQAAFNFAKENLDLPKIGVEYVKCIGSEKKHCLDEEDIKKISSYLAEIHADDEEVEKITETLYYLM